MTSSTAITLSSAIHASICRKNNNQRLMGSVGAHSDLTPPAGPARAAARALATLPFTLTCTRRGVTHSLSRRRQSSAAQNRVDRPSISSPCPTESPLIETTHPPEQNTPALL